LDRPRARDSPDFVFHGEELAMREFSFTSHVSRRLPIPILEQEVVPYRSCYGDEKMRCLARMPCP